jgi:hypothetical protein
MLVQALLFCGVLAIALLLRIHSLDASAFWVDEAESSINALTILEHGYPTDSYLGLPIYENAFMRSWPGNPEYAWRDSSYSDRHFAVYHGWLPLYSIAASFSLQHVTPAKGASTSVQYDLAERKRRTRAARLPAVLFGMCFLLLLFVGGSILYGRDAGWAAMIIGALDTNAIGLSRQARYYSAEIALTTACCISLWLIFKKCRWRDIFVASFCFILLFYTHLLSFVTGAACCALATPFILRRHPRAFWKLSALAGIVAAGTLPWLIVTGFFSYQNHIPRAWAFLKFPHDLMEYPPFHASGIVLGALLVIFCAVFFLFRTRLSRHTVAALARLAGPATLLCTWAICGYALFLLSMPLVSFDRSRLNFSYWGPAVLLAAIVCAALGRVLTRRYSALLGSVLLAIIFLLTGHSLTEERNLVGEPWQVSSGILDSLASLNLDRDTRVYAAPNDQLTLTFYSGLPIQDILPVRSSYLNSYPGRIIYVDTRISLDTRALKPENVRSVAHEYGKPLSLSEAEQWSEALQTYDYRREVLNYREAPLPAFANAILDEHRRETLDTFEHFSFDLLLRGFRVRSWAECRTVLRFRFHNPAAHTGSRANYAKRLQGANVILVPSADAAIYESASPKAEADVRSLAEQAPVPHGAIGQPTSSLAPPIRAQFLPSDYVRRNTGSRRPDL